MDDARWLRRKVAEQERVVHRETALLEHYKAALDLVVAPKNAGAHEVAGGVAVGEDVRETAREKPKAEIVRAAIRPLKEPWDFRDVDAAQKKANGSLSTEEVKETVHRLNKRGELRLHTRAAGHKPAKYYPGLLSPAKGKGRAEAPGAAQK